MADPKEQTPAVPDQRPGLDPQVRKVALFLSIAVLVLTFSVWMLAFVPKPVGGILASVAGALAFAALLHLLRKP